jgi:hypothetical protein
VFGLQQSLLATDDRSSATWRPSSSDQSSRCVGRGDIDADVERHNDREQAVLRARKERYEYRCWTTAVTLFEILPSLQHAATPRIDRAIWPLTTHVDELGRLCVGEMALTEVADEFGTPTYVIDEADFRHRIRRYRAALPEARFVYAGKAS